MSPTVLRAGVVALAASACVRSVPEATKDPTPSATPPAVPAPSAPAPSAARAVAPDTSAAALAAQSLQERLEREATTRGVDTPRAEEVFAAFEKLGVKLVEKGQHAAAPFGALYCLGGRTEQDLHFSVCEFRDAEAVKKGKETSLTAFASVPNRELFVHKKTLLTVRQGTKTAESQAKVKELVRTFDKL